MASSYDQIPLPPAHLAVVVRSLLSATPEIREKILQDVEYNIFAFPAGLLTCDFLSDSGTSAMTDVQWAALIRGDESYGRNWGYYCLLDAFRDIFERGNNQEQVYQRILAGSADVEFYRDKLLVPSEDGFVNGGPHQLERPNFFIVPQGRCAENLLFSTLGDVIARSQPDKTFIRSVLISNGFFDTTAANASVAGFQLKVFTKPGLTDAFPKKLIGKENHFKGDLDIAGTQVFLNEHPGQVTMILMTITNNWAAAQPVSMANLRAAAVLARENAVPLFFDACRFAENAYFIQRFEEGYAAKTIAEIVQEMFTYADGFTISLKKDGLANMGGVLCFRDKGLFAQRYEGIGLLMKERQIVSYGNDSYGGMSGRDLMASAVGLYEVTKELYLHNRISQVQHFAQRLLDRGIDVLSPPGGHAVFLDMNEFFRGCDRLPDDFASVGFTLELIKEFGIRAAEAGPFGWEWDHKSEEDRLKIPNLVRFAVPRHLMADEHINYTVAAIKKLHSQRHNIPNVVITRGKNMRLRHFSCGLKPVPVDRSNRGTFLETVCRQLEHLSAAVEQNVRDKEQLLQALTLTTGRWGELQVPKVADLSGRSWLSYLSNDHSPVEYSVAVTQATGEAELRFLVESQPAGNDLTRLRDEAMRLNEDIERQYSATASFDRFNRIRGLFMPSQPDDKSKLVVWHSCALSKTGPEWKIYLNPRISGEEKCLSVTREAFERLEMSDAWKQVESIMSPSDSVVYFSLDLSSEKSESRVKIYISHAGISATEVANKHSAICPDIDAYEIQRFCRVMAGGPGGSYNDKSVMSCFAFTNKSPAQPVGTVHFPIDAYAANDAVVHERIEQYYAASMSSVSPRCREVYNKVLSAVQRRPLTQGPGIHAWVSLKMQRNGGLVNTFYLSSELFGGVSGGP